MSERIVSIDDFLRSNRSVTIFGAGSSGLTTLGFLWRKGIHVSFLCDNDRNKQGTKINGIAVLNPAQLQDDKNSPILIASDWAKDIAQQLNQLGIRNYSHFVPSAPDHFCPDSILNSLDQLEEVYNLLEDDASKETFLSQIEFRLTLDSAVLKVAPYRQYFHPGVKPALGDVILDGGAWTGDTATQFCRQLNSNCTVFAFEPDDSNFHLLLETIVKEGLQDQVLLLKSGLSRKNGSVSFQSCAENSMQCRIESGGESRIDVVSVDSFASEKAIRIDLIKLDVEGSEEEVLKGARQTLSEARPKLQVCVYHKPDDLWKIPLLVRDLNPNYRFFLGHHSQTLFETVLYAVER
ncbi:MAG: FkbM family methyltransferase [Acidobacteriota bacterium]